MSLSLYIHVPWCVRKCVYCDFVSVERSVVSMDDYVGAVAVEMERQKTKRKIDGPLATVYLGGGTPSLLEPRQIGKLIDSARNIFGIERVAEISMEANPGTVDEAKLAGYVEAGINRVSLGVQSTRDESLKKLGRIHSAADARTAYDLARRGGFASVGIDMMYGLPDQTLDDWRRDLNEALSWSPDHVSAYMLKPPEGWVVPEEDVLAEMYLLTTELCEKAGLLQYEVSNFAISGKECRHNRVYWQRENFLGLGPAAHSFVAGRTRGDFGERWMNDPDVEGYVESMKTGTAEAYEEELSEAMSRDEEVMLSLRTREGLDATNFREKYGDVAADALNLAMKRFIDIGRAVETKDGFRLTTTGLLVADEISAQVTAIVDEKIRRPDRKG